MVSFDSGTEAEALEEWADEPYPTFEFNEPRPPKPPVRDPRSQRFFGSFYTSKATHFPKADVVYRPVDNNAVKNLIMGFNHYTWETHQIVWSRTTDPYALFAEFAGKTRLIVLPGTKGGVLKWLESKIGTEKLVVPTKTKKKKEGKMPKTKKKVADRTLFQEWVTISTAGHDLVSQDDILAGDLVLWSPTEESRNPDVIHFYIAQDDRHGYRQNESGEYRILNREVTTLPEDHGFYLSKTNDVLSLDSFGWRVADFARDKIAYLDRGEVQKNYAPLVLLVSSVEPLG